MITTATCRTTGCGNEGIPVVLTNPLDDTGTPIRYEAVICGPCGQLIDDVDVTE